MLMGLLCVSGCQGEPGRGFSLVQAVEPSLAPHGEKFVVTSSAANNGFSLDAWKTAEEGKSIFSINGVSGTARTEEPGSFDWIWISTSNQLPSGIGSTCYLRLVDGLGNVFDSTQAHAVELAQGGKFMEDQKQPAERAIVFRIPARWASSPRVRVELHEGRDLLAIWQVDGVQFSQRKIAQGEPVTIEKDGVTLQSSLEAIYRTDPSGMIRSSAVLTIRPTGLPDFERQTLVMDSPVIADGNLVNVGDEPYRLELSQPAQPGDKVKVKGTIYSYTRSLNLNETSRCTMVRSGDQYVYKNPYTMILSLPSRRRVVVPNFEVTSTSSKVRKDWIEFEIPVKWNDGLPFSPETPIGFKVARIYDTSRGEVIEQPEGQRESFRVRMSRRHAEDLTVGKFDLHIYVEERTLKGAIPFEFEITATESNVFSLKSVAQRLGIVVP